jgi:hypothetical protein
MGLDDMIHQRQPQSSARNVALIGERSTIEFLEDPGLLCRCNADAAIADANHRVISLTPQAKLNFAHVARGLHSRVLHGIVEQVHYGLLDGVTITIHWGKAGFDIEVKLEAALLEWISNRAGRGSDHIFE